MKEAQRQAKGASLPLSTAEMQALFDFVDEELCKGDCDNTLRYTIAFLEQKQLPKEQVITWLENAGGYCDCEVIANAEEEFKSSLPRHLN